MNRRLAQHEFIFIILFTIISTVLFTKYLNTLQFTQSSVINTTTMSSSTVIPKLTLSAAFKNRRTVYALSDVMTVPDSKIQEILHDALLHTPSAFNCQESRLVLLVKDEHKKYWDLAYKAVKPTVPEQLFEKLYEPRIKMFRAAYGTILFYSDPAPLSAQAAKWPIIADKFPPWSDHASGMLQYAIWTLLSAEGLGCSLQHYNPRLNADISKEWNVPTDWDLKAEMVFGAPEGPAREKTFEPVENHRLFVHGA
ncbi:Nitroreductase-like protein [Bombardia bombarda]|uniref:Nitroreductase-like protein n=1 Tax=Bombardia bombarda TaxID=252184 RepID=A0AA39TW44_9PEZI|nr:Nitroreductase-like protein [Bombardia bombarda]